MTKGVAPCPLPRIGRERYSESQRLHLPRVPIHLALRAVPSRFINHPPGHPTTRATEITISYADLPLSRQIYRRPFTTFFPVFADLSPSPLALIVSSAPISSRVPQESPGGERENPCTRLSERKTRMICAIDRNPLYIFSSCPSSLYGDTKIFLP